MLFRRTMVLFIPQEQFSFDSCTQEIGTTCNQYLQFHIVDEQQKVAFAILHFIRKTDHWYS